MCVVCASFDGMGYNMRKTMKRFQEEELKACSTVTQIVSSKTV